MRRYGLIILFFIVLITPFALKRAVGTQPTKAHSRDAQRLVIITPHVESIRREFADAFERWHLEKFGQPVVVDYRTYGGGTEIMRYFSSAQPLFDRIGTYNIDLVWGGGDYLFDRQLKRGGYLEPVRLRDELLKKAFPSPTLNGLPLFDSGPEPTWYGVALSSFGIVYNRDVLRYLKLPEPKTWRDLTDAKLLGWFVAGDANRSVSSRQVYMIIVERAMIDASNAGRSEDAGWGDGMGLVRLICSNARYYTDAGSAVPNVIASGDAAVGMAIDFYARAQVDAVGESRMGYVEPAGATAITVDPVALVKGAQHRELAVRFMEYLLTEEAQRLWNTRAGAPGGPRSTSLRRLPIMRDVYLNPTNFTDPVDPFDKNFAFASSPKRQATLSFLGELIEVSCSNLLEELRDTRRAIENSPRRDELRAKLGQFPFDQQEALRRAAEFEKANPLRKLELKRRWQDEFREEYRRLREEAQR
ncbi:MAG: extracellular solute-binding protein [Anaerolineae bacterium]|nr:extracellular solute-binding protein [Phycisphaerae bacterium]